MVTKRIGIQNMHAYKLFWKLEEYKNSICESNLEMLVVCL